MLYQIMWTYNNVRILWLALGRKCLDAVLTINEVNGLDYGMADTVNYLKPEDDLTLDYTTYCFIFYFTIIYYL